MATLTARQRRAQHKSRGGAALDMNLVSLIDVFTILIFFLLSSSGGVETLASPKAVKLPLANVEQAAKETVVLVITRDEILAEGRRVANVRDVLADSTGTTDTIPALKAELDLLAQRKAVRTETANRIASDGHAITILADKDIPYSLLRKVMFSCALAGFSDVSFAVRRKDG